MSKYADKEKSSNREINRDYATTLSYERLVEYYCDYQELKEETEFYKENRAMLKSDLFFAPLFCLATACICFSSLKHEISFFQYILQALLPAFTACASLSIIKWLIGSFLPLSKNKTIPVTVYPVIAIAIPIICYFIL